ncbi:MAG: hypothetical protein H6578_10675 [Chitinophagales bacterium]|nr:hypothetical protein [Chitinophagales bacterium]
MLKSNNAYIVGVEKIIPEKYNPEYVADIMFPTNYYDAGTNRMVKMLSKRINIENRTSVLDYDVYPEIAVKNEDDAPVIWGKKLVNKLCNKYHISEEEIGYFGLSYNISSHRDVLPNLATQIVRETNLSNVEVCSELPYYGCASPVFLIEEAVDYCKEYGKPAIIFSYDQCTYDSRLIDKNNPNFRKSIITCLLFNDGGVAMLIVPENYKYKFPNTKLKILDIKTKYKPGNKIHMEEGTFLIDSDLKDFMPQFISHDLVKPFLEKNFLTTNDIKEWSIHQGGAELLKKFADEECLSLTAEQLLPSLKSFNEYGNVSSASCLLVLEKLFNSYKHRSPFDKGVILGFGAGYYYGMVLYQRCGSIPVLP